MYNLDYDKWDDYLDAWVNSHAEELLDAVKSQLNDEIFSIDFAASLAYSHYNNKDCDVFFDAFGLNWNHALCYLDYINTNDNYKKEVDESYQKYIENLND